MKKVIDWIKDNKLVSLLILAAIAWVLYMGFKQGGWWNKSASRMFIPNEDPTKRTRCPAGMYAGTQNGKWGCFSER